MSTWNSSSRASLVRLQLMPTAAESHALPTRDPSATIHLTSRPSSAAIRGSVARRQWNSPPLELFPREPSSPRQRRPTSAASLRSKTRPEEIVTKDGVRKGAAVPRHSMVGSAVTGNILATSCKLDSTKPLKRSSLTAEAQIDAIARGSPKRISQVTWTRIQKVNEGQGAQDSVFDHEDRRKQLTQNQQLEAAAAARQDIVRSAQVNRTLKKRDVDADTVRPLIEIAYWSPFLEVRRDAAAALASLSRNPANLELLCEVGTLGALISMLNADKGKSDPTIAYECAQTLACMVELDAVKLKVLQAPDGIECVFGLLHSTDARIRCTAFELVSNLVRIEELRLAVAKREGFAYMLESCTSKDSRIRLLAATILNRLAESQENRFLFYHSSHFHTLAGILQDPFVERDVAFRKELLGLVHLLVLEEENGRKFVELNLVPTLLLILDSRKSTQQICVLVVWILESVSMNRKNHPALVDSNALPRIVNLCFGSPRGLALVPPRRPHTARAPRKDSPAISASKALVPPIATSSGVANGVISTSTNAPSALSPLECPTLSPQLNGLLRPAFALFCEMAKNPSNREHVIRSKLIDYIAAHNLYAASDKRVRRSVITLLTFLICKEREREKDRRAMTPGLEATDSEDKAVTVEAEFKHYIELLARGIIKCLFGILEGNDFTMKVDAIAAIAQLTEDTNSRITMCKPQLLRSLQEFALHPLLQTRTNIARIIANFADRPENILKLVDEGMLGILVKYVSPVSRNNDVLVEATRAIAAMSMVHVTRYKLVECGVLGTLLQYRKSPSTSPEVRMNATIAISNLRHDAAALSIQSIYRGWCVRAHHARAIMTRKRRIRKMTSVRKIQMDQSIINGLARLKSVSDQIN